MFCENARTQVSVWCKTGVSGTSDYSIKLDQEKMTLEIFACLGSHCVHLCIVWPMLPKRNFTSSSLWNHISVHISQAISLFPSLQSSAPSADQTSLRSHYTGSSSSQAFLSRISAAYTAKGMSLLPFRERQNSCCNVWEWTCSHFPARLLSTER